MGFYGKIGWEDLIPLKASHFCKLAFLKVFNLN